MTLNEAAELLGVSPDTLRDRSYRVKRGDWVWVTQEPTERGRVLTFYASKKGEPRKALVRTARHDRIVLVRHLIREVTAR